MLQASNRIVNRYFATFVLVLLLRLCYYNVRCILLVTKGVNKISRLAEVRKTKGLSQEKLAAISGVHRVTIARIESGKISPNICTLEKLSSALKVKVGELIERAG